MNRPPLSRETIKRQYLLFDSYLNCGKQYSTSCGCCQLEGVLLALKPHAFRVRSVSETANGGVVYSSESSDYYGLLSPVSQGSVYQGWGLELKNPFVLFAENADAIGIQPGDRIGIGGQVYTVIGIERRDVNDTANHAKILLERLDYA